MQGCLFKHLTNSTTLTHKEVLGMHSFEYRVDIFKRIMCTAQRIATHNSSLVEAWDCLRFCVKHGYIGFPKKSSNEFSVVSYLSPRRQGAPTTLDDIKQLLGIIICFSDESMPCNPVQTVTTKGIHFVQSAYVSPQNRILVIGYADWHTPVELALKLLHEARHARHVFGEQFEGLSPLDPDELHESRTWKYELDLLDSYGGKPWHQAIQQEMSFVVSQYEKRNRSPGEEYFTMSGRKYPALDSVFGVSPEPSKTERALLVGMRANFLLAENASSINNDMAYANIISAYYNHIQR